MSIEDLVSGAPAPEKTRESREFAGFKLRLSAKVGKVVLDTEVRYKKVDVKPLFDVEGEIVKVGPNGYPVKTVVSKQWLEMFPNGESKPISEAEVREVQRLPDGTIQEISKFQRISQVNIDEQRAVEDITFEGPVSYGTVIPRYMVDSWNQTDTYIWWGNLKVFAEELERSNLAAIFPWTFGRGYKVTTGLAYPIREGDKLFLVCVLSDGIKELNKALTGETVETRVPVLNKPVLKKKANIKL